MRNCSQHRFAICGWPTFEFKNADSDYKNDNIQIQENSVIHQNSFRWPKPQ